MTDTISDIRVGDTICYRVSESALRVVTVYEIDGRGVWVQDHPDLYPFIIALDDKEWSIADHGDCEDGRCEHESYLCRPCGASFCGPTGFETHCCADYYREDAYHPDDW